MMPKTNLSLSASWELVFSRPRVVSCAGVVPQAAVDGAAALHFVALVLLLLLMDTLECVGIFVCVRIVFFINKGKNNSVFFAFLPYDCVLLTKACPFIELFFSFVF